MLFEKTTISTLLFVMLFFFSQMTWSADRVESFTDEDLTCQVTLPKGWDHTPRIFGFSTLVYKGEKETRVSIGIKATLLKAEGFVDEHVKAEMEDFKADKLSWVKEESGTLVQDFTSQQNALEPNSVKTSIAYTIDGQSNLELTYFYFRVSRLVHAKAMFNDPKKNHAAEIKQVENILKGLKCSKK